MKQLAIRVITLENVTAEQAELMVCPYCDTFVVDYCTPCNEYKMVTMQEYLEMFGSWKS